MTWSVNCVITYSTGTKTFTITDSKLYILVSALSIRDKEKLLEQLKSGFKCSNIWNKYQSKVSTQAQNQYLDYLIDSSFHRVNRLFALPFENITERRVHTGYYFPKIEIKDCNVMIDGRNFFD